MWFISNTVILNKEQGIPLADDILRSEWFFLLLILPVLVYIFVSLNERYSLLEIIKIVFSNKFAQSIYRNITPGVQISRLMLGALSIISIATFIMIVELHFDIAFNNLKPQILWLINLLFISLAIGLRYILIIVVGYVTRTTDAFSEYFFNISSGYKLIGILLMFLNFLISYLVSIPDVYIIFFSFLIISVILLFRTIRLVYIFLIRRFSLFYLILYLCALEIIPALIFIKYLSGQEH